MSGQIFTTWLLKAAQAPRCKRERSYFQKSTLTHLGSWGLNKTQRTQPRSQASLKCHAVSTNAPFLMAIGILTLPRVHLALRSKWTCHQKVWAKYVLSIQLTQLASYILWRWQPKCQYTVNLSNRQNLSAALPCVEFGHLFLLPPLLGSLSATHSGFSV